MNVPTRGNPAPNPQGQRPIPKFDLAVLEPLDLWRKALIERARAQQDLAAAKTAIEREKAIRRCDNATVKVARARGAFEAALRAEAEASA